jgi:hypothetical protein
MTLWADSMSDLPRGEAWRRVYREYLEALRTGTEDEMWRKVVASLPPVDKNIPGWFMRRQDELKAAIKKLQVEAVRGWNRQTQFLEIGAQHMAFAMGPGQVYKLARSLRYNDVFALPPGITSPEVVEVDEETAGQMQDTGTLVYMDHQTVAVFEHPDDPNFVLGMPIDPEEMPVPAAEQTVEVSDDMPPAEGINPTPEQMAEWGYAEDAICETCGYYIKDHTWDGETLSCVSE